MFFDGSSRFDPAAIAAANATWNQEQAQQCLNQGKPSILDNYPYGDVDVSRSNIKSVSVGSEA